MNLLYTLVLILVVSISVNSQENKDSVIAEVFRTSGITGTFILYDMQEDKHFSNDFQRAEKRFLPASTFKIFNSLAALETEVIKDQDEIIKWDGVLRGWEKWDMDHNLRTAFQYSAVWFYQELARRIGEERMQSFIYKTEYGNQNISGGIDLFWLEGDLQISPMEQIAFLQKLYLNELPFSRRTMDIVKEIMIREKNDIYTLRAKTGWADKIGWYVGYVEKGEDIYFFALNMNIVNDEDVSKRIELTDIILQKLKVTVDE